MEQFARSSENFCIPFTTTTVSPVAREQWKSPSMQYLSPRYRRQLAHQLSGNAEVRERFSLSKSLTKGVVGCHVNTFVMENKRATVNAAAAATSSSDNRFFLTETDIVGQIVANANSPRSCPPKTERLKELSEAQMETIRELSQTLSQKMKQLIDLTGIVGVAYLG